jgi:hypothetical protein
VTATELNLHVNTGLTGVNAAPKALLGGGGVHLFIIMATASDVIRVVACPRAEVAFNDSEKSGRITFAGLHICRKLNFECAAS